MGVGHRVFDTVCQVGGECGFPSKLTGAGGGGCAFCLIVPGWCTMLGSLACYTVCVHVCTTHDHCDGQVWHVHLLCVSSICSHACSGLRVMTLLLLSHGTR